MAVDYLHRLVVRGAPHDVRELRRQLHREYPRAIGDQSWIEVVPFSFASLYEIAPAARRIEKDPPFDPYELSAWPIRRLAPRISEARYQFQTRNLEIEPFILAVSRARPLLTFTLATLCLDDSSVAGYRLRAGVRQMCTVSQRRAETYWARARTKFGVDGDAVYDNDQAEHWVDEEMLHAALTHWDTARGGRRASSGRRGRWRWWNREPLRDLATERQIAAFEIAERLDSKKTRR